MNNVMKKVYNQAVAQTIDKFLADDEGKYNFDEDGEAGEGSVDSAKGSPPTLLC